MTTYIAFTPSNSAAPKFQVTLDGALYTIVLTWSLFGQRYYVNCYALDGVWIFSIPLTETNAGLPLEALSWDVTKEMVTATTTIPHGYPLGTEIKLTIAGCAPTAYNGAIVAMVTSPNTFTYPLGVDPGNATTFGSASYLISLTAGYFNSTLVYRDGQFEISP